MEWIWTVVIIWVAVVSIVVTSAIVIFIGFRMGRLTKGEQATLFPEFSRNTPAYEDDPGGVFDDHVAGGKYDQIEQSEQTERMKTT